MVILISELRIQVNVIQMLNQYEVIILCICYLVNTNNNKENNLHYWWNNEKRWLYKNNISRGKLSTLGINHTNNSNSTTLESTLIQIKTNGSKLQATPYEALHDSIELDGNSSIEVSTHGYNGTHCDKSKCTCAIVILIYHQCENSILEWPICWCHH